MKPFWKCAIFPFLLVSCGGGSLSSSSFEPEPPSSESREEETSSDLPSSSTSSSHDFGDPSTWPGDAIKARDLGDAILTPYPYDERYDWGQSILFDEEDQIYKMWWCRQSPYDTIWYGESRDLKHWDNLQKIMVVEEDSTWIKMHVGKPTVLKVDGKYRMYFEAPCTIEGWREFNNNVLMAESDDGIHFSLYQGDIGEPCPVIRMSDEKILESIEYASTSLSGYGYYGIGQPSAVYKDGAYYLYCTYSLERGDRFYRFSSKDGIHFDDGVQVFYRAGSGVKYNELTGKYMMVYAMDQDGQSKVFYMESEDGVHFTYEDYSAASANKNIVARGSGFVRGYPDFVADEQGHVASCTCYVSYMEGKAAEGGADWRTYSNTWDIHIAMMNVPEFANRAMVLPNGEVSSSETLKAYSDRNAPYDAQWATLAHIDAPMSVDGKKDDGYASIGDIARASYSENAVPGKGKGTLYASSTARRLSLFAELKDLSGDLDDKIVILIDEDENAETLDDITRIEATRFGIEIIGDSSRVDAAWSGQGTSMNLEVSLDFENPIAVEKRIGVDCYVYSRSESVHQKNLVCYSDCLASYKPG
ncbi:MAG: hypothetical protein ACI4UT_03655, partial [Candidatus Enteromonas sp.]